MLTQLLAGTTEYLQLAYDHIDWNWKHREGRQAAEDHIAQIWKHRDVSHLVYQSQSSEVEAQRGLATCLKSHSTERGKRRGLVTCLRLNRSDLKPSNIRQFAYITKLSYGSTERLGISLRSHSS